MADSPLVRLFQDPSRFDPSRDGQIPWRRDPLTIGARALYMTARMTFSRHPTDVVVWLRSMIQRRTPLAMALPWLTFDAIRAVEQYLRPGSRVFEYGSGHSTLYWAQRGAQVYSVEGDSGWFELALERLAGFDQVAVRFEREQQGYVHCIDEVPEDFDLVLIDGNYRLACIEAAVPRILPGGLLVVDNTDWHWFNDVDRLIPAGWNKQVFGGCAPFIGYPSQTTIWVKPAA
ncbi:hypothetical protein CKO25_10505 [Thiocapsa imhoffii]|uniref:Uncharacterized protein n=1 Tax=Thiocapsa imhoffii TaxID=382777 RepID=A0A9X0WIA8_9GAMM|nr:hypothetical protein [Thiocapsa imhoffii]MBK1645075.1 hypothetical protein [Thiocapsa imhoffii]